LNGGTRDVDNLILKQENVFKVSQILSDLTLILTFFKKCAIMGLYNKMYLL